MGEERRGRGRGRGRGLEWCVAGVVRAVVCSMCLMELEWTGTRSVCGDGGKDVWIAAGARRKSNAVGWLWWWCGGVWTWALHDVSS